MSSIMTAVSGSWDRLEENTKQLLESLTGRITIDGVQKYCHWEITGCTEAEFRELIAKPDALRRNMHTGGPSSEIIHSSHEETVNGKQTVNNSSTTQEHYALEPEIYQFVPNLMPKKAPTTGMKITFSTAQLTVYSMKNFNLFITSTPHNKPIIKIFEKRKDQEDSLMAILPTIKRVPLPVSLPMAALNNASSPLSLLPPSAAPTAMASSATALPSVPAPLDDPYANFDDMLKGFEVDSHGESSAASASDPSTASKAKATITELVDPPAHSTATAAAVKVSPSATVTPPVTPANTPIPKAIVHMLNAKLGIEKATSPKSVKPTPVSSAAADKATSSAAASPSSISKPVVASTTGSAASSPATAPTSAANAVERLRARRKK